MRAGSIIVTALLAIAAVVQMSAIDIWLSDSVYDFALNHWMIDHSSSIWRPFLYEGPKVLIIAFGLVIIATVARPEWLPLLGFSRREAIFLFLCLAAVPAVVGVVREYSGVSCPRVLQQYGGQIENRFGQVEFSRFFDGEQTGKCWPSGHASGGFALLALSFLCRSRRTRLAFTALAIGTGAAMGAYQVFRGAHFASHIVVTMLLSLVLISLLRIMLMKESW